MKLSLEKNLFKYGYHDTTISRIVVSDHQIKFIFDEGIYELCDNGEESSLTGPCSISILFNDDTNNIFDSVVLMKVSEKKSIFRADAEQFFKKEGFDNYDVSDVYFSRFNNTLLFDVGKKNFRLLMYISNCIDLLFEKN